MGKHTKETETSGWLLLQLLLTLLSFKETNANSLMLASSAPPSAMRPAMARQATVSALGGFHSAPASGGSADFGRSRKSLSLGLSIEGTGAASLNALAATRTNQAAESSSSGEQRSRPDKLGLDPPNCYTNLVRRFKRSSRSLMRLSRGLGEATELKKILADQLTKVDANLVRDECKREFDFGSVGEGEAAKFDGVDLVTKVVSKLLEQIDGLVDELRRKRPAAAAAAAELEETEADGEEEEEEDGEAELKFYEVIEFLRKNLLSGARSLMVGELARANRPMLSVSLASIGPFSGQQIRNLMNTLSGPLELIGNVLGLLEGLNVGYAVELLMDEEFRSILSELHRRDPMPFMICRDKDKRRATNKEPMC